MAFVGRTVAALAAGWLAIFAATSAAELKTPENGTERDVETARELLDSWSGQPQLLEQAREKVARALEADPSNYRALKELARYQMMAGYINNGRSATYGRRSYQVGNFVPGTLELSESTIREALRINPKYAEGYVFLGYLQYQQTKLDEAAGTLAKAEAIGTDDPWLNLNWASLDEARGDRRSATERWQRVLRSGTTNLKALSAAYGHLIESYMRAGDHEKAVALYEEQIKRNPTNAWERGNFAQYLNQTLGRNDEAVAQARAALKIMDYGIGRQILANALYGKWADMVAEGKEAAAEPYFQEAKAINPRLDDVMVYGASMPKGERLAKALIAKKGISIDAKVDDGSTALLVATNLNRAPTVRFLLALRADPNIPDRVGWTPLLSAADEGNAEIVGMLLASGADPKATKRGKNAADLADSKGYGDLAALLRKRASEAK